MVLLNFEFLNHPFYFICIQLRLHLLLL